MVEIYTEKYGFSRADAQSMVDITFKYKQFFVQHMMVEELGLMYGYDEPTPMKRGTESDFVLQSNSNPERAPNGRPAIVKFRGSVSVQFFSPVVLSGVLLPHDLGEAPALWRLHAVNSLSPRVEPFYSVRGLKCVLGVTGGRLVVAR